MAHTLTWQERHHKQPARLQRALNGAVGIYAGAMAPARKRRGGWSEAL